MFSLVFHYVFLLLPPVPQKSSGKPLVVVEKSLDGLHVAERSTWTSLFPLMLERLLLTRRSYWKYKMESANDSMEEKLAGTPVKPPVVAVHLIACFGLCCRWLMGSRQWGRQPWKKTVSALGICLPESQEEKLQKLELVTLTSSMDIAWMLVSHHHHWAITRPHLKSIWSARDRRLSQPSQSSWNCGLSEARNCSLHEEPNLSYPLTWLSDPSSLLAEKNFRKREEKVKERTGTCLKVLEPREVPWWRKCITWLSTLGL